MTKLPGGIVTFTVTALLENPLCIIDLVEQIHRHPHWECYILPTVFAVFVRQSCLLEEDPVEVFERYDSDIMINSKILTTISREPYRFGKILELIEEGKLALMQSPSLYHGALPGSKEAERDRWVTTQYMTVIKTPSQHIEDSWGTFVSEYSNKDEKEIRASIEAEIVKDLAQLQMQPSIRENYRRFVVIKALQEDMAYNKDGVGSLPWIILVEEADGFSSLSGEAFKNLNLATISPRLVLLSKLKVKHQTELACRVMAIPF